VVAHEQQELSRFMQHLACYSKKEFARRGDDIYERVVRSQVEPEHNGDFVVIDIESGDFEVDEDELVASDRLLASHPGAQIWLRQVGSRYARRFGSRLRSMAQ
jgi:hypothetical protein